MSHPKDRRQRVMHLLKATHWEKPKGLRDFPHELEQSKCSVGGGEG